MHHRFTRTLAALGVAISVANALPLSAQTDYYNTDRGRPLHIEDAYAIERRAVEIQAAPLRLERVEGGAYQWSVEPELAFGVLPRTQVEVGMPLSVIDDAGSRTTGIRGFDLSVLYNFNAETAVPALGISAHALLPVGSLAPGDAYFAFKGIATRTFAWARFHLNAGYTAGPEPAAGDALSVEGSRWSAGIAVDRTFPLRSLLIGAEVVVQQPLITADDAVLLTGVGARYQLAPRWAVDAGLGARFTGEHRGWYVTVGSAHSFGLPWRR